MAIMQLRDDLRSSLLEMLYSDRGYGISFVSTERALTGSPDDFDFSEAVSYDMDIFPILFKDNSK